MPSRSLRRDAIPHYVNQAQSLQLLDVSEGRSALLRAGHRITIALTIFLVGPALSQTAGNSQAVVQPSPSLTTLKAAVRRVDLDIVVTNPAGLPVTGLRQGDFKVEEEGKQQSVRTFDVHAAAMEGPLKARSMPQLSHNTFVNMQVHPEAGTLTVLLYDALNTALSDQNFARRELLRFVQHRRPDTQVAIFVLGTRLRLLQGFTDDVDLLSAALTSKGAKTHALALQARSSQIAPTPGGMDGDPTFDTMLQDFARMDIGDQALLAQGRRDITYDALIQLGRFLNAVQGRKNLVWLSSAFQLNRQGLDMLSLSHTAVYPIDVKGVRANPAFSAANNAAYGPDGIRFGITTRTLALQENAVRIGMDMLAEDTGGRAFYGTNDLQDAVNRAVNQGSTYYSLTYEPTNPNYDGSLRHIKVTLKESGYNLAYRRTYYADDFDAVAKAAADAPESPLTPALERGTPLTHGLLVEAHLDAAGPPVAATPEQMRVLSQYAAMRTGKRQPGSAAPIMMQRYVVSYGLIGQQLETSADAAGVRQASLEFGVIAYDEDGRKLNGTDTRLDDTLSADRYAKAMNDGYHVVQSIAVPVAARSLRLAARDLRGDRVGSLEVQLPLAPTAQGKTPAPAP